jgi:hypothetical protein
MEEENEMRASFNERHTEEKEKPSFSLMTLG